MISKETTYILFDFFRKGGTLLISLHATIQYQISTSERRSEKLNTHTIRFITEHSIHTRFRYGLSFTDSRKMPIMFKIQPKKKNPATNWRRLIFPYETNVAGIIHGGRYVNYELSNP